MAKDPSNSGEFSFNDLKRGLGIFAPGDSLGPYTLIEELGTGGFGDVFRARQEKPVQRDVAVKILKPGRDSREVLSRFAAEEQALARMSHPNIATFLDSGATPTGRPYFVMEYIDGESITDAADRLRLSIDERLRLFCQICSGVEHAHQKGVVHRDLKPGNILLLEDGAQRTPKIIDFGIAKAIDEPLIEGFESTAAGQFVGTPEYMAPEQLNLSDTTTDTRADVYSLGVLLYALLTGLQPFSFAGFDRRAWPTIILDREPERPSARLLAMKPNARRRAADRRSTSIETLVRAVRGDLDWIVLKCLEKDPGRRYPSVSGLVADIRRYQRDEPVEVGPPSALYRLRKMFRRNRLQFVAAGIVAGTLATAIAVSAVLVADLIREREFNRDFRVSELTRRSRSLSYGSATEANTLLEKALALSPGSVEVRVERAFQNALRGELSEATEELSAVVSESGNPTAVALLAGFTTPSSFSMEEAPSGIPRPEWLFARAVVENDSVRAIEFLDEALRAREWYAEALWFRAWHLKESNQHERALSDALELRRNQSHNPVIEFLVGSILSSLGRYDEGLASIENGLLMAPNSRLGIYNRAWTLMRMGRYKDAEADVGRLATFPQLEWDEADTIGRVLLECDRSEAAEGFLGIAVELRPEEGSSWLALALARSASGRWAKALSALDHAEKTHAAPELVLGERIAVLLSLERFDDALVDCRGVRATNPARGMALQIRVHRFQKDLDAARALEREARSQHMKASDWRVELAMTEWLLGSPEKAVLLFREAADVDPGAQWTIMHAWEIEAFSLDSEGASTLLRRAAADSAMKPLVDLLEGRTGLKELLGRAQSRGDRLTAHYFAGIKEILGENPGLAVKHLDQALTYNLTGWTEHELAIHRRRLVGRSAG